MTKRYQPAGTLLHHDRYDQIQTHETHSQLSSSSVKSTMQSNINKIGKYSKFILIKTIDKKTLSLILYFS